MSERSERAAFLVQIFAPSGCGPQVRNPEVEKGGSETLVVAGPHMNRRIELAYEREWEGTRGRLRITDATVA